MKKDSRQGRRIEKMDGALTIVIPMPTRMRIMDLVVTTLIERSTTTTSVKDSGVGTKMDIIVGRSLEVTQMANTTYWVIFCRRFLTSNHWLIN